MLKETILDEAWPGLVVEENNLTVQISTIRLTLAQVPDGDRWIETIARRGYRFVGPVSRSRRGLADDAQPLGNIPLALTSFVGGERELVELKSLLTKNVSVTEQDAGNDTWSVMDHFALRAARAGNVERAARIAGFADASFAAKQATRDQRGTLACCVARVTARATCPDDARAACRRRRPADRARGVPARSRRLSAARTLPRRMPGRFPPIAAPSTRGLHVR